MKIIINILLLVCLMFSCTDAKREKENIYKIKSRNYVDKNSQKKHPVLIENSKDSIRVDEIISFYRKFMINYILEGTLNRKDGIAMSYFTPAFIQKLEKLYLEEYDCKNCGCLAEWLFVTRGNDDNPDVNIRNMRIAPLGNNWYKVKFGKQQKNSYKVKIIRQGNKYKISDIINNNTI